jgi:hypothetical protein
LFLAQPPCGSTRHKDKGAGEANGFVDAAESGVNTKPSVKGGPTLTIGRGLHHCGVVAWHGMEFHKITTTTPVAWHGTPCSVCVFVCPCVDRQTDRQTDRQRQLVACAVVWWWWHCG